MEPRKSWPVARGACDLKNGRVIFHIFLSSQKRFSRNSKDEVGFFHFFKVVSHWDRSVQLLHLADFATCPGAGPGPELDWPARNQPCTGLFMAHIHQKKTEQAVPTVAAHTDFRHTPYLWMQIGTEMLFVAHWNNVGMGFGQATAQ